MLTECYVRREGSIYIVCEKYEIVRQCNVPVFSDKGGRITDTKKTAQVNQVVGETKETPYKTAEEAEEHVSRSMKVLQQKAS